jgi:ABC-type transport system substrate-binding protein
VKTAYDPVFKLSAGGMCFVPTLADEPTPISETGMEHYENINDTHVALYTEAPFSMSPYLLSRVFIVSPTQFAKLGNWPDFQKSPAGTGPSEVVRVSPHVSIEPARNEDRRDRAWVPKVDQLILPPIPDFNTWVAASRAGQVDRIEYPAPYALPTLRTAGFHRIVTRGQPPASNGPWVTLL